MNTDLLKCPFCGGSADKVIESIDLGMSDWSDGLGSPSHLGYSRSEYAQCNKCYAKSSIEIWNNRVE